MSSAEKIPEDPRYQRVAEDDPRRCQGLAALGGEKQQCRIISLPHSDYCVIHAGTPGNPVKKKYERRIYNLQRYKERVGDISDNPSARFLGEELGILRLMVEEILNACKGQFDLIMYSRQLGELIIKIKDIVVAMDRLESRAGLTLNKQQALNIAGRLIQAVSNVVTDPDVLDEISEEISKIFLENEAINPSRAFDDDQPKRIGYDRMQGHTPTKDIPID